MRTAVVLGATGQDGNYLVRFLSEQGYSVTAVARRVSFQRDFLDRFADCPRVELVEGDVTDIASLVHILSARLPLEIYNLAAQSFVPTSFKQPVLTGEFTALGVTRMLEAIRMVDPTIRFYQASSSEMFGKVQEIPQTEKTPF